MIKIVRGVYGFMDKNGIVRPKTEADEPFELLPEQEARLVKIGVAEYVGGIEDEQAGETDHDGIEDEQDPIGMDEMPPVDLSSLSVKDLRQIGKECGLTFKVGTTKDAMVEAITAAQTAMITDAEDEDGESAPVFDASEAVQ